MMVSYHGEDLSVGTEGPGPAGGQLWRARWGDDPFFADFETPDRHSTPVGELFTLGDAARDRWEAEHPGVRPEPKPTPAVVERADDGVLQPDGSIGAHTG